MRVLILLLVLSNAALLAWGLSRPPTAPPGPPPPGGNLVLLSEVEQEPAVPAAETAVVSPAEAEPTGEEVAPAQAVPGEAGAQKAEEGDAADAPAAAESAQQVADPGASATESEPVPEGASQDEAAGTDAPAPETQPEPTPVATPTQPPAPACRVLAPTLRPPDARRLAARWRRQGYDVAVELVTERQRLGYWVYLPSVPSLDEARETMDRLRRAGVEDYALVGGGGATNIVSLGLFDRRPYAERRLEQMRELGFAARMDERDREVSAARLSLRPTEQDLPPVPNGWAWQQVECPADAGSSAALAPVPAQ